MLVFADEYCSHVARGELTFMMRSGRKVPTPAIPMPDLAVPYAAPAPVKLETTWSAFVMLVRREVGNWEKRTAKDHGGCDAGLVRENMVSGPGCCSSRVTVAW